VSFHEAFVAARKDFGLADNPRGEGATPESLLSAWEEFANRCESGFDGYLDEYYNLLGVRSVLFGMLNSPRLIGYPEIVEVAYRTVQADRRVVACFDMDEHPDIERSGISDGTAWYWNHFPRIRSRRFAEELRRHYGLQGH